ncbi:MAG: ABC transporter substrate-binding protein [Pseudomonadota bacterium]|jgi:phospholipid transport system substrate-binding protein|uniref:Phospholipid transport system substrate-binding protein n=1 Tax=Actibacterium naphthalenivorans TaxID=1614693 RepID=A0A840C8F7_9RHOB|nr:MULTISPECIES: ABC transporter substrate-binding protein [Actibacterium]KGB82461.1 ABC transporter [Rhodovulum sp. NI22]MBB4021350.1 phospholipid transport system substrate-binding protein [Actibacterium naphthalenivorans]MDY6860706.1 ABC transporter substrate-binding protein [Pseudomonadota bacterium]|tara:strand:+ start:5399 stop:6004 length:606 start_codon:yes stop_codon:yes gene_type:complete
MLNNPSRRAALAGLIALPAAFALPRSAFALNTAEARALIDGLVAEINRVINSGMSEAKMFVAFENIFIKYSDVPIIARSALGIAARSATPSQMEAFTVAFRGYLSRKYGRRFREFIGGRLEVNEARAVKSFYEVKTTAYLKGEAPFDVTFLVSDKSGRDLFFNMYIEGVNMVASERTEIGAMLDQRRGNIDLLTQDLRKAG